MFMRQNLPSLLIAAAVGLASTGVAKAQMTEAEYVETYETVK